MMKKLIFIFAGLTLCLAGQAFVTLPSLFSDHMVLQQNTTVTVWGWAKPGERVTIRGSWDPDKEYTYRVTSNSVWSLDVETPPAGGPYTMTVSGYNTIEVSDIMVGEVWLGSGQSNMEWTPSGGIIGGEEEIPNANYQEIRLFNVFTTTAGTPQQLVQGEWVVCTPETMVNFSAVMYFFGKELHNRLNVPVGLICSAWGGTPVEIWTPEPAISGDRILDMAAKKLDPVPWGPVLPGVAYNSMIYPLIPFRIKGALWYQGEANVGYPTHYARGLTTLIESWRAAWGYDFPFYFVQIAPWSGYGSDNVNGAIIRDQQRRVLQMAPQTGMVVVSDIGNLKDIHPKNKTDVGKRLAAWALYNDYGMKDLVYSGPLISGWSKEKGKVILTFDHADPGLTAGEGSLKGFEIRDGDGNWQEAQASIDKNNVMVTIPGGSATGVRFAFGNDLESSLFNKAGLPASSFEILF